MMSLPLMSSTFTLGATPINRKKDSLKSTRRGILIVGRTGLLGLAGATFLVALHSGDDASIGRAQDQKRQESNQSNGKDQKNRASNRQRSNKKPGSHHGNKKGSGRNQGKQKGVRLETGSLLPAKLISEEAGEFSAHMLLPFETFSSEAELAEAVTEAEKLNLFILPEATEQVASSPEP
jgi:hypothetical protein